jgi:hypothetical protein
VYNKIITDIEAVFASSTWTTHNIVTLPDNYMGKIGNVTEYVQLKVMPTTGETVGYDAYKEQKGLVAVKIFVKAGEGQRRVMAIAEFLNNLLQHKHLTNGTELGASYLSIEGLDPANSSLYSASYIIPFTKYGE